MSASTATDDILQLNHIAVGDTNADGISDLVVTTGGNVDPSVVVVPQKKNGGYRTPVVYPSLDIPSPVRVADMTGDGLADVVVLHDGWEAVGVYTQQPDGTLGAERRFYHPINNARPHSQGIALGDITGDGIRDVVFGGDIFGVELMISSGPTPPIETRLIGSAPTTVARDESLTFTFAGFHARSSFECSLDGSAYRPCESPHTIHPKASLDHLFQVRAVVAGAADGSPAQARFSTRAADLALRLVANRQPTGSNHIRLRARAHNRGPHHAASARLAFRLGSGLRPGPVADGCAWRTRTRVVTCPLGWLEPGETDLQLLDLQVVRRRHTTVTTSLTSATWDPNRSNNTHNARFTRR